MLGGALFFSFEAKGEAGREGLSGSFEGSAAAAFRGATGLGGAGLGLGATGGGLGLSSSGCRGRAADVPRRLSAPLGTRLRLASVALAQQAASGAERRGDATGGSAKGWLLTVRVGSVVTGTMGLPRGWVVGVGEVLVGGCGEGGGGTCAGEGAGGWLAGSGEGVLRPEGELSCCQAMNVRRARVAARIKEGIWFFGAVGRRVLFLVGVRAVWLLRAMDGGSPFKEERVFRGVVLMTRCLFVRGRR